MHAQGRTGENPPPLHLHDIPASCAAPLSNPAVLQDVPAALFSQPAAHAAHVSEPMLELGSVTVAYTEPSGLMYQPKLFMSQLLQSRTYNIHAPP